MRAPRGKAVCAGTHSIKFLGWIIFKLHSSRSCKHYTTKYTHTFAVSEELERPRIALLSQSFFSATQAVTYADVIARYRSCPAVSHIWAFIVFPSTWMLLVANSTPMVLLLSKLNSLRVKRDRRLLLPTPESPISTTTRQKWQEDQIPDAEYSFTIACKKHLLPKVWRKEWIAKATILAMDQLSRSWYLQRTRAATFSSFLNRL